MHKSRIRGRVEGGRNHVIPIRLSDDEYALIADAAHIKRISPSTFVAAVAVERAKRTVNKEKK